MGIKLDAQVTIKNLENMHEQSLPPFQHERPRTTMSIEPVACVARVCLFAPLFCLFVKIIIGLSGDESLEGTTAQPPQVSLRELA
jgi:hypothetical protein